MQYFDEFEQDEMNDTKLNLLEKGTVYAFTTYCIAVAKKARKAKTYGELKAIMKRFEDFLETKSEEAAKTPESVEAIQGLIKEIEDETTVVTHLQ